MYLGAKLSFICCLVSAPLRTFSMLPLQLRKARPHLVPILAVNAVTSASRHEAKEDHIETLGANCLPGDSVTANLSKKSSAVKDERCSESCQA
jgi:hypothetical protein